MTQALLHYAVREIESTYGETVSVWDKAKSLHKFGRYDSLGTSLITVTALGQNETYQTSNTIDSISSSSGSDVHSVRIEGHTVSGTGADAEFTFVIQDVTLTGQTRKALATPLARVSRLYNVSGTTTVGDVYVYRNSAITGGVPDSLATAHIKMLAGEEQSYKAATTFSNTDYFIMTSLNASVNKRTTSAFVDFVLEIRQVGGVFRPVTQFSLGTGQTFTRTGEPWYIIPKNADVRVRAAGSTTSIAVNASFDGFLATTLVNRWKQDHFNFIP